MDRTLDERKRDRWLQVAVLTTCSLAHVLLGLWLARPVRLSPPHDVVLEVSFIPAATRTTAPAFPLAPPRPATPRAAGRMRAPTPSAPPDPPTRQPPAETLPSAQLDTARLLDVADMAARAAAGPMQSAPRDPTRRRVPKLPGRAAPYTPEAIVLRDPITPATVVAMVGSLFGGNYDPCPDTLSKIRDLTSRNDPRDADELMILIDRERRRCH